MSCNYRSPMSRKQCDFTRLVLAGYDIELNKGNPQDFFVLFDGPKETIYEGGVWRVHITLPEEYPFSSPSIGFVNKIYHPNVDELSGSVCLDVLNQLWTPLYSLVNVIEIFLPQLLTYPNPSDPLNGDAASLLLNDKKKYDERVKEYINLYSRPEIYAKNRKRLISNPTYSPKVKTIGSIKTHDTDTIQVEEKTDENKESLNHTIKKDDTSYLKSDKCEILINQNKNETEFNSDSTCDITTNNFYTSEVKILIHDNHVENKDTKQENDADDDEDDVDYTEMEHHKFNQNDTDDLIDFDDF